MGAHHQGVGRTSELKARNSTARGGGFSLSGHAVGAYGAESLTVPEEPMSFSRRTLLTTLAAAPFASMLSRPAFAAYPDKPIRLIVPFAAGGNADLVARIVAEGMSASLGQPIIVETRAGAGGSLGAAAVATAPAGRLHAAHRIERPADRQSVRAGQAQLRSAQGFRRRRAGQPRAACDRAAQLGAGEGRGRAYRAVEEETDHARHLRRRLSASHLTLARFNAADRREHRARAVSRRRRADPRRARGHGVRRDDRSLDAARTSQPGQGPHPGRRLEPAARPRRRTCRP